MKTHIVDDNESWRHAVRVRQPGDKIVVTNAPGRPDLVYDVLPGRRLIGPRHDDGSPRGAVDTRFYRVTWVPGERSKVVVGGQSEGSH